MASSNTPETGGEPIQSRIIRPTAEEELFYAKKDRLMAEETLILEGLKQAVWRGDITEDEKSVWLNEYIEKRNAGTDA